jgi:hypothetical protein
MLLEAVNYAMKYWCDSQVYCLCHMVTTKVMLITA